MNMRSSFLIRGTISVLECLRWTCLHPQRAWQYLQLCLLHVWAPHSLWSVRVPVWMHHHRPPRATPSPSPNMHLPSTGFQTLISRGRLPTGDSCSLWIASRSVSLSWIRLSLMRWHSPPCRRPLETMVLRLTDPDPCCVMNSSQRTTQILFLTHRRLGFLWIEPLFMPLKIYSADT